MESSTLFVLILSMVTLADVVLSRRIHASENPVAVGSNVTLFSKVNIQKGTWRFNNGLIVFKYPGGYILDKGWQDRIIFNSTTEALTIRSVMLNESGVYQLEEVNVFQEELKLSVQVPLSNVTLWVKETNLVEFNDTAVIMCSVSEGTSLSYKWLKSNSNVSDSEEAQLKSENATLTIVGVTRYDQGLYRCNVSNGLGHEISPSVRLNISYGPSNTTMMIMPAKYMYKTGSNLTLSCLTESSPPAMVQWMVNDERLNQYGHQLQLESITLSNAGTYKCVFHNRVTLRFNSASTRIRVMDPLTTVVMNRTSGPAILHESFTLQCEVSDTVNRIQWFKDGQLISADNTTIFGIDNKTLTLNPVGHSDSGHYRCQAFNLVSNMTSSPYAVIVNYGPEMPTIMGPNVVRTGDSVTLRCHAKSFPSSHYKWHFNNFEVANMSEYTTPPLTKEWSGKYICMAFNNITNENSTAYIMITVVDPIENVQLKAQMNPAIEGHSYYMTCNVTGPADQIHWMKDGEMVHVDNRTVFYMDNSTIMFMPVGRSDTGYYHCMAKNALGNMTSAHYMLDVNYGPDMPTIMGPNVVRTGDNVTLRCHAKSSPPSHYKWYFNDSEVSNMSEYTTPSLTKELSGKYICMAFNNITDKNSTAYIMITVVDPIDNVQIQAQADPAIEGHSYNMTCNVTGPADHIHWMKDWEILQADNRTVFYMNNSMVMFMPVKRSDTGYYQCMAKNALGNMTSAQYMLDVNYGPEMPTIMGPNAVRTGDSVTLRCHAKSSPPSQYKWYFNDSEVSRMSEYTTPPLTEESIRKYICMAYNNITDKNSTAYIMITVVDPIENLQVEAQMDPAIEGHPYNLTCNVTGTADYIYWMKDGEMLHVDNRTVFYMDNSMVMFMPVERSDTGYYQCMAKNALGNMTSAQYMLDVNFGPEAVMIDGPAFAETGSQISFKCSAMSLPPSYFSWLFKPNETGHHDTQYIYVENMVGNSSVFTVGPLSLNMSGEYICMVYNPVTRKNITSSTVLTVIEAIESVMIHSNTTPINNQNFTLTCHVVGPYEMIYWMKGSMHINMSASNSDPHMWYTEKNMLHFSPLTLNNNGTYQCVAANKAAHHKSPKYNLLVNYGPLHVHITGPDSGKEGTSVSLTCSADSWPECDFQWFFNNLSMVRKDGPVITFSATKENEGSYKCEATNPVTDITMYNSKTFSVSDHACAVHFYTQKGLMFMGLLTFTAHMLFH